MTRGQRRDVCFQVGQLMARFHALPYEELHGKRKVTGASSLSALCPGISCVGSGFSKPRYTWISED
jgi:hypothetical protein